MFHLTVTSLRITLLKSHIDLSFSARKHRQDILTLPIGVFLYPSKDQAISFPKHTQDGQPFEVNYSKPTQKDEKTKTIWHMLKNMFQSKKIDQPSVYDESETFEEEDEEDALIGKDLFGEEW